jgi:transcription antitermination factor NusG
MEQNWYIICTKQMQEKRVINALNKKGIKNYYPQVKLKTEESNKKNNEQPLFNAYVFAYLNSNDLPVVKAISKVINVMYWCNKEVVISNEEIEAIRLMTDNYNNIELQKTTVEMGAPLNIMEETCNEMRSNFLVIKHLGVAATFPSLGVKLIATGNKMQQNIDQIKTFIHRIKNSNVPLNLSFK